MTARRSHSRFPPRSRSVDALSTSHVELLSVDQRPSHRPSHRRASDSVPAGRPYDHRQALPLGFPSPLPNGLSLDDIIEILAELWELIKDIVAAMCCCSRAGDDEIGLHNNPTPEDVIRNIIMAGREESIHDPAGAAPYSPVATFYDARSSTSRSKIHRTAPIAT